MFDISPIQILIVLAIALLVFGPRRLPEMGRSIGRGLREFKETLAGEEPRAPRQRAPEPPGSPSPDPPPPEPRPRAAEDPAARPPAAPDEGDDSDLEGLIVPGDRPPGRGSAPG